MNDQIREEEDEAWQKFHFNACYFQSENKDDYDDGYNDDDDEDDGSKSLSLSSTVRPEVEWISITDDDEVF